MDAAAKVLEQLYTAMMPIAIPPIAILSSACNFISRAAKQMQQYWWDHLALMAQML